MLIRYWWVIWDTPRLVTQVQEIKRLLCVYNSNLCYHFYFFLISLFLFISFLMYLFLCCFYYFYCGIISLLLSHSSSTLHIVIPFICLVSFEVSEHDLTRVLMPIHDWHLYPDVASSSLDIFHLARVLHPFKGVFRGYSAFLSQHSPFIVHIKDVTMNLAFPIQHHHVEPGIDIFSWDGWMFLYPRS